MGNGQRGLRRAGVLAAIACLAVPAGAFGEIRSGSGSDPTGDQVTAEQDITSVSASYDTAGSITVTTTFAAPPTTAAATLLFATVGTAAGGTCGAPLAIVGAGTDPSQSFATAAASEDSTTSIPATKSATGASITVASTSGAFAAHSYDCVRVAVGPSSSIVLDATDAIITLAAPATPTPTPPVVVPTPQPQPPPVLTRAQKLAKALKACRAKKTLAARRSCERAARVKFAPPLTRAQKLARALRACSTIKSPAAKRRCIANARATFGPAKAGPLAKRLFWYPGADVGFVCGGTCFKGYAFVDAKWVHRGIRSSDGLFPACTARTADGEGDGCVPYTYNASTRTGAIDGRPFTVSADGRRLDVSGKLNYGLGTIPPAGTRTDLYLKAINVFGNPLLAQTIFTHWLQMSRDGRFILSSTTLGSFGGPAFAFEGHYSSAAPDERGRYAFLADGRLQFTYDDGTVRTDNVFVKDDGANANPAVVGLFLGGSSYYVPSD